MPNEIYDSRILRVDLVDLAANKHEFLLIKRAEGKPATSVKKEESKVPMPTVDELKSAIEALEKREDLTNEEKASLEKMKTAVEAMEKNSTEGKEVQSEPQKKEDDPPQNPSATVTKSTEGSGNHSEDFLNKMNEISSAIQGLTKSFEGVEKSTKEVNDSITDLQERVEALENARGVKKSAYGQDFTTKKSNKSGTYDGVLFGQSK